MARISGGTLAAKILKAEGVEFIFTLVGGHIYPLLNACIDEGIKIIDVRHEAAAAHMAEGIALTTGKPGVCLVTAGPGFTNMLTGTANAFVASSPAVYLAGHSPLARFDTLPLQDLNQIDVVKPLTKWARTVFQTERIADYLSMAFRNAVAGRPGPVYLEIPIDVFYGSVEEEKVSIPAGYRTESRPAGDPAQIDKALELLKTAKRPMIVVGSGGWWSQAQHALKAFVEKSGIPAFTRNNGRGLISDAHPLCFGASALSGLFKADVALIIGTQLDFTIASGKFPPELKTIWIDIDAAAIGRNRRIDIGIVADAKAALEQLTCGIKAGNYDEWVQMLKDAKLARDEKNKALTESDNTPIHPLRLCNELKNIVDENTIVTIDGGDISTFGSQIIPTYAPGQHLANGASTFGCLGVGLPFALAAKAAFPEKTVVSLGGDGTFCLNGLEFDTAMRHNLPVLSVIGNDGCWGMIKYPMEKAFGTERIRACDLPFRRYEKIVEALGGHGEFVEEPSQIRPALERALASGKPACVNVLTSRP